MPPMFTQRTLLEGKWPIGILAALALATAVWCPVPGMGLLPLALLLFTVSFFRDPEVEIPADAAVIVAPATGKIVEIKTVQEPHYLKGESIRVAIFLSVFDVHVQRAPLAGTIRAVGYHPGKFLDVRHPKASEENEHRWIGLETADGYRVVVRQIAGLIARRIVGWCGDGAELAKGERYGMIKFGSRVELFLPPGTEIVARVGDYATGGATVLARRK